MTDPRPKTEQPKEQTVPRVVPEPSTTAVPTVPIVVGPQPKSPDSRGGNTPNVANPKGPAGLSTQAKP